MIWRLRRKFILISTLSMLGVFALIFVLIVVSGYSSLDRTMDELTDAVSSGRWKFPEPDDDAPPPKDSKGKPDGMGSEVRFSTRYFTVTYEDDGEVDVDTEHIHAVDADEAVAYAAAVRDGGARGWYGIYRYKVYADDGETAIVFVDGSMNRSQLRTQLLNTAAVLSGSVAVVLLLIVLFSRVAVKPAAESYAKQKQFITDANHELKTPLTLILTNLDIAETELGQNEWLDDIRAEGRQMAELVGQMVALCRMDEEKPPLSKAEFDLSETVADTVSEFEPLARAQGKRMESEILPAVRCFGDEGAIRRLLAILLDNAVKYCDPAGEIRVTLSCKRHAVLEVVNSYAAVGEADLNRLFDRFYRSDKARTSGSGFGIGLSIAQATASAHRATLSAYRAGSSEIGFRVVFRA